MCEKILIYKFKDQRNSDVQSFEFSEPTQNQGYEVISIEGLIATSMIVAKSIVLSGDTHYHLKK